jgi:hypothetical protein
MLRALIIGLAVTLMEYSGALAQSCMGNPVAVQVLGSGAPGFLKDRANTSYLLWIGNQAKIIVDAGAGAYVRFGQVQAKFSDLSTDPREPFASRPFLRFSIPHGNLPTLAYRVETQAVTVVFSSDQNGTNPRFPDFAKGADILVMHLAIGVGANNPNQAVPIAVTLMPSRS